MTPKPTPVSDDDEEITRRCRESRAAQGLPPKIEDAATLDAIAIILRSIDVGGDAA
jgi:hypothetical protein